MAFEGGILTDGLLLVPCGILGNSASVAQLRGTNLQPFRGCLGCLTLCFPCLFGRSPWSNKYDPPLEDGAMPSARLRKLEVEANNAFDQYRDLYVSSTLQSPLLSLFPSADRRDTQWVQKVATSCL